MAKSGFGIGDYVIQDGWKTPRQIIELDDPWLVVAVGFTSVRWHKSTCRVVDPADRPPQAKT
jgi:hypothetical protein